MILNTIGFSGKSAEEFFTILLKNNVRSLIDIRLNNKSQLFGFTNIKHLPYFLTLHGIEYFYKPEYAPTKELMNDYRNKSVDWKEYERCYIEIIKKKNIVENIEWSFFDNAVLLCSEPIAEKCHRRLLAEMLAKQNPRIEVRHIG